MIIYIHICNPGAFGRKTAAAISAAQLPQMTVEAWQHCTGRKNLKVGISYLAAHDFKK
jgi:hypothetical protein